MYLLQCINRELCMRTTANRDNAGKDKKDDSRSRRDYCGEGIANSLSQLINAEKGKRKAHGSHYNAAIGAGFWKKQEMAPSTRGMHDIAMPQLVQEAAWHDNCYFKAALMMMKSCFFSVNLTLPPETSRAAPLSSFFAEAMAVP